MNPTATTRVSLAEIPKDNGPFECLPQLELHELENVEICEHTLLAMVSTSLRNLCMSNSSIIESVSSGLPRGQLFGAMLGKVIAKASLEVLKVEDGEDWERSDDSEL